MTTATTTTTADAIRNLIVCDTQFGWAGETTLQLPEILDLQERGWLIEGDENNEFSLTDAGHAVVASALAQGSAAPVMWWDGGERAITAREKALIEEHRPSCFSIPLVPASGQASANPTAWLVAWRDVIAATGEAVERRSLLLHNAVGDFRAIDPDARVTPLYDGPPAQGIDLSPIAKRKVEEPLYTMTTKADTALVGPVLVQAAHGEGRPGGVQRWGMGSKDAREPVGTVTASGSGGHAVAAASLVTLRNNMAGADPQQPLATIAAQGEHHALATAFLEQANGGFYEGGGRDARDPVSTITATGSQQQLVTAGLAQLSPEHQEGALRVAAFLVKYYGTGANVPSLADPVDTVTTKDRLALVTVVIKGTPYVIVDIGLRMLKPHELYRAQGFPAGYVIDRTANGTPLSTSAAVRMVGNSVSPPPLRALAEANLDPESIPLAVAA